MSNMMDSNVVEAVSGMRAPASKECYKTKCEGSKEFVHAAHGVSLSGSSTKDLGGP